MSDPWDEMDDPWVDISNSPRRISRKTRRNIFDYLRTCGFPWYGRMGELAFLGRLYDLDALPSEDTRYRTATADIRQHRINNADWPDDWIFTDSRLKLGSGPDAVLLEFVAELVHPVVRADAAQTSQMVGRFNELLRPEGWHLTTSDSMSGQPVYAPARLGDDTASSTPEVSNPPHAVQHGSIHPVTESSLDPASRRKVFLVHGRNDAARDAMTEFLQAIDLVVISWTDAANAARQHVGHPPTTLEIVQAGINEAAGVVVLFTPDDQVRLHPGLRGIEEELVGQARPNVILEAGIALAIAAPKVQMVRMGPLREISDIDGINFVNIGNDIARREDLAYRLEGLGLAVQLQNVRRWMRAGDFDDALSFLSAPPPFDQHSGTKPPEELQIKSRHATDLEREALRSEIESICKSALAQGWEIMNNNRSRLRIKGPRGQVSAFTIDSKPSNSRLELRKFAHELRAAGLRVHHSVRDPIRAPELVD